MRVCLDAGHGGKRRGCTMGPSDEASWTLGLVLKARQLLEGLPQDYRVILTRDRDLDLDLAVRGQIAQAEGAELAVSCHVNAQAIETGKVVSTEDGRQVPELLPVAQRYHGALYFCAAGSPRLQQMARHLHTRLPATLAQGSKADPVVPIPVELTTDDWRARAWAVLSRHTCPAMLVEFGYSTHPADLAVLMSSEGQWQAARALVSGIEYYRVQQVLDP